jgi:DNA invertase Pin-like site-specific DNA recombinase
MFVRAYLRAPTDRQEAVRAKQQLESFADERSLSITKFYIENESGASLKRLKLFELIDDAREDDILLIEQVDRLSRLDEAGWDVLKATLKAK